MLGALDAGRLRFLVQAFRGRDRRFERERPAHADDTRYGLGAVYQYFLGRRFVVGDALERNVRHDSADFLPAAVLLPLVHEATRRPAFFLFQFVVVERSREQTLTGQCQRHATGDTGDPPSAPSLGHKRGRTAAARGIQDKVARVGGHQDATLKDFRVCLNDVERFRRTAQRVPPVG